MVRWRDEWIDEWMNISEKENSWVRDHAESQCKAWTKPGTISGWKIWPVIRGRNVASQDLYLYNINYEQLYINSPKHNAPSNSGASSQLPVYLILNFQSPKLKKPFQEWMKHGSHILYYSMNKIPLVHKFKMWIPRDSRDSPNPRILIKSVWDRLSDLWSS